MTDRRKALEQLAERGYHAGADQMIEQVESRLASDGWLQPSRGRSGRRRSGNWPARGQSVSMGLLMGATVFVGVVATGAISLVVRSSADPSTGGVLSSPESPIATADAAGQPLDSEAQSVPGPQFTVSEVAADEAPVAEHPAMSNDGTSFQRVQDTLKATSLAYEEFPSFIPSAAVKDGRAVIVGGNEKRTSGIWYSDGGAWTPANIEFPDGVQIGEGNGNYRLGDGIQHVNATDSGFVAWEPVQVIDNSEPEWAGTLVFTSEDGANWTASLVEEQFADLIAWQGGYLAVAFEPTVSPTSTAIWSPDLETWTTVADLGSGEAFQIQAEDGSVIVKLRVFQTQTEEDSSVTGLASGETVRTVKLEPAAGSS